MKDFLQKVINGNGISPSEDCLRSFKENFAEAVNVDWYDRKTYFEAVFYNGNLEHIAHFSPDGKLMEYRQLLPFDYLPGPLRDLAYEKGEVMSIVLKNKGNMIEYEIIVSNPRRKRYLLTLSDSGELKEEKAL